MNILIPSEKLAFQVWWAMMWRMLILSMLGGMLTGLVIEIICFVVGASPNEAQGSTMLASVVVGFFISVKVVKHMMTEGFGEYRLAVVRK